MKDKVSVIIVTYNSKRYLKLCIESIMTQNYPLEIIVVDNCSTDGTVEFIRDNFSSVKIIESKKNLGYGAGNNSGVKHAEGDYLVILNPDTVVEDGWLEELVKPLKEEKLITTPKILTYDASVILACGIITHFSGLSFKRDLGSESIVHKKPEYVSGFSGCCFAMRKKDFIALGGFDENFFMYNDDTDLSWRMHLKGFKIMFVPTSIVRHDYTLKVPPEKMYHLEKGRYMILKKYLSWKDFLLLAISFIIAEFLTFGYASKLGGNGFFCKFRAIHDCLTTKTCKVGGDKKKLIRHLSTAIPLDQLTDNKVEKMFKIVANKIFEWNFRVVR